MCIKKVNLKEVKWFKNIGIMLVLLIMLMISGRFIFFKSYLHFQKVQFRKTILINSMQDMKELVFEEGCLYQDSKGIEWKEENKELVVGGIYHEVVAIKKEGKKHRVFLIPDKAENELFRSFFIMHNDENSGVKSQWLLLLCLTYVMPKSIDLAKPEPQIHLLTNRSHQIQLQSFRSELIKPPIFSLS